MQKLHGGGVLTDFIQVSVLVGTYMAWLFFPDRFGVDEVVPRLAMAVGALE